ncbi:MAG: response regulator [Ignavibacteria bacterium]|jgi:signal transduction histidine kinase|nr:response regulator [Ignavibacteria bacterium]MCU7501761.1 response regulator [Ignavibacteria bacterium]MCU7516832.1 response regulator [Ignavibacteria bacterium]
MPEKILPEKILIAEDSLTQLESLKYILQKNSFNVISAQDGLLALNAALENRPSLVISDIIMPNMDGYELCRRLKSFEQTRDIPVILLTNLTDSREVIKGLQAGADNFLTKPYSPDFLIAKIRDILENRKSRMQNSNPSGNEGIKIKFEGEQYIINSPRAQVIDLLLSTFENAVQKNEELEEANRQLLNVQQELKRKNLELERSNRELELFAYVASHDLQEPVRNLSNYTALLERRYKEKFDEKGRQMLEFISEGARRMHGLIKDLLSYSRLSNMENKFERVELNTIVREALDNLKSSIEESNAQVSYSRLPAVKAVRAQMLQLFQNLISNAIKYRNTQKNPEIEIGCTQNKGMHVFFIKDNGIGIDKSYFEKIFVIFQRLHDRGSYPGSGIGLTICKKIVERHGGRMWVESEIGKGSAFYFSLPLL